MQAHGKLNVREQLSLTPGGKIDPGADMELWQLLDHVPWQRRRQVSAVGIGSNSRDEASYAGPGPLVGSAPCEAEASDQVPTTYLNSTTQTLITSQLNLQRKIMIMS